MDRDWAQSFVDEWVRAWNDHDVERVLEHFHDDAVFTAPIAALLVEGSGGVIRGRAALRHYWSEGLRRIPDLHFEVVGVYVGVRTVVMQTTASPADAALLLAHGAGARPIVGVGLRGTIEEFLDSSRDGLGSAYTSTSRNGRRHGDRHRSLYVTGTGSWFDG